MKRAAVRTGKRFQTEEAVAGYLFAAPVILGLIIFVIGPMILSAIVSLTDWNVLTAPHFIGIKNYIHLFTTDLYFANSLLVTSYYVVGSVILTIFYSLVVAVLLNQDARGKGIFRSIFYLPSIVPIVASSALWLWLYNPNFGLFNEVLQSLGLPKSKFLVDQTTVIPSLIVMGIWGGAGNTIVIFLAALQGVPRQLLEAVEIDGGNWFHKFRAVTLPMISPVTFFNLVIGLITAFQVFAQPYIMTSGGPNNASLFYVYLMYREGFQRNNMGLASAEAWILFLLVSVLSILLFRWSRGWVHYEGGNQ
ncbi:MAG TPA: sugar ABC transporter permease [Spirochaetia bacterium]|nr:sugar ABC transporter permease [Spirochaetia bacterium]